MFLDGSITGSENKLNSNDMGGSTVKSILNVIETNKNGIISFSVAYNDGSFEEFTADNLPENVDDFIYYAKEFDESYKKTRNGIMYFKA